MPMQSKRSRSSSAGRRCDKTFASTLTSLRREYWSPSTLQTRSPLQESGTAAST
eukprot:CAMPEP_0195046258 /NCGR_PEP_ID=MMETSP0347-20130606/22388_1 /TAXON_ID=2932 /ORGANISM="Alexandrium fundyense, Strain CCMP1719" /LENGTH=53 /DNA_ID=CAMNT_0040074227 /DNA_START=48 /DNA_END=205 /DNA_ORIENTATION=-